MNKNNKKITILIYFFSLLLCLDNKDSYVILVSFDGFRYDYIERENTPNFDYIENNGVKANKI